MNARILAPLAVAAALVVPAVSVATTTAERTGTFDAQGTGTIVAQGRLSAAFGTIDGTGLIIVRDRLGDAVVKIGKVRQRAKVIRVGGRRVRVFTIRRASGAFLVQGRGLRMEIRSPNADVSVTMFGRAAVTRLAGTGVYQLNAGPETQWSSAPLPLQIKPPPPVPPREKSLEPAGATA